MNVREDGVREKATWSALVGGAYIAPQESRAGYVYLRSISKNILKKFLLLLYEVLFVCLRMKDINADVGLCSSNVYFQKIGKRQFQFYDLKWY